jgi:hypothetical protein
VQFGYQLGHCTGKLVVGPADVVCFGEPLHVVGGAEVVCLGVLLHVVGGAEVVCLGVLLHVVDGGVLGFGTVDPGGGTVPVPP